MLTDNRREILALIANQPRGNNAAEVVITILNSRFEMGFRMHTAIALS